MTQEELAAASEVLKAMAHPIRLGTIELLATEEMTVTELYTTLGCSQSVMSHQLTLLRREGLISMRREGNTKYCSLRNRDFLRLFKCLQTHIHDVLKID
ncbi:MAG: helix-turn-helix transcriptional regulator [Kiritimatiellae bacterium]|nr:helix-turn-helix transcriptional regulator [Kiritimatiellia bacterium]